MKEKKKKICKGCQWEEKKFSIPIGNSVPFAKNKNCENCKYKNKDFEGVCENCRCYDKFEEK